MYISCVGFWDMLKYPETGLGLNLDCGWVEDSDIATNIPQIYNKYTTNIPYKKRYVIYDYNMFWNKRVKK